MDDARRIIKAFRVNDLEALVIETAAENLGVPVGRLLRDAVLKKSNEILGQVVEEHGNKAD